MDPALSRARFERDIDHIRKNPDVFEKMDIRIVKVEFPVLIVSLHWNLKNQKIFLHIQADEYDYLPAEGWWVDDNDVQLVPGKGQIPQGNGFQAQSPPYGENRSWFCYPGWRAYHYHQSHQLPPWSAFRSQNQYHIPAIIVQLNHDLNKGGIQPA